MTTRRGFFGLLAAAPFGVAEAEHRLKLCPAVLDRVSTGETEPGYAEWRAALADGRAVTVKVGGVDVSKKCEAADAGAGWARCYVEGPDGGPYLDERGEVVRETLRGFVTITVS